MVAIPNEGRDVRWRGGTAAACGVAEEAEAAAGEVAGAPAELIDSPSVRESASVEPPEASWEPSRELPAPLVAPLRRAVGSLVELDEFGLV